MKQNTARNRIAIILFNVMIVFVMFGISLPAYGAESITVQSKTPEVINIPSAGIAFEKGTEPRKYTPQRDAANPPATSGTYYSTEWVVSGSEGDYTLTLSGEDISLNAGALTELGYDPNDVTHIVIKDGAKAISFGGLWDYYNLQVLELPDSLTEIGSHALLNCLSLMEVQIPEDVTEVGSRAFLNTGDMQGIEFPSAMDDTAEGRLMIDNAIYDGSFCETVDGVDQFAASIEKADQILEELDLEEKSEYEKVVSIYNWITSHITYDYDALEIDWDAEENQDAIRYDQSIYGALFHGKCVCGGYARTAALLMNRAGISCVFMLSNEHGWNIVRIGNTYYEIDSTWDAGLDPLDYQHFLREKAYFDDLECHTTVEMYTPTFYKTHPIVELQTAGDYKYLVINEKAKIISCTNTTDTDTFTVAAELGGYPVTELLGITFEGTDSIRAIIIPEGIETIGNASFAEFNYLESLILPVSLKQISEDAFSRGLFLEDIAIEYAGTCAQYGELVASTQNEIIRLASSVTCSDGSYMYPYRIENCTTILDQKRYVYTGEPIHPVPAVTYDGETLIPDVDYTIDYDEVEGVGTGTIYIYGEGKFSGYGILLFEVVPQTTTLIKAKAGKKKITVKWTPQTAKTKGYQIQIATKNNFKKGVKKYTIANKKTASYVVRGLKSKKTYYVRIRTYGYDEYMDTTIYSDWSNVKKTKVK